MIVDFHTHIFPDAVAPGTIAFLAKAANLTPVGEGTSIALLRLMEAEGIGISVNLPVATKPSQTDSINRFAAAVTAEKRGIISFGAIHPDCEDPEAVLDRIASMGLRGIKLHPDYQGAMIDDLRYLRIISGALRRNLHVAVHAGEDEATPTPVHCPPDASLRMLTALKKEIAGSRGRVILAHLGGNRQWDEVERLLIGQSVYLDLSFVCGRISCAQMLDIIRAHGSERILFGSDYPWTDPAQDLATLATLPLSEEERRRILVGNAEDLLGDALY